MSTRTDTDIVSLNFDPDDLVTFYWEKEGHRSNRVFKLNKLSDDLFWFTQVSNSDGAGRNGDNVTEFIYRFVDHNSIRIGWKDKYFLTAIREE